VGAGLRQHKEAGGFIGPATAGAVTYAAALPLLQLYRIASAPIDPGRASTAVAVTLACLPVQVWLVWSAARDHLGRAQHWALAALALLVAAAVPLGGVDLLGAAYVLGALVLITLRPPWSLAAFAALAAAPVAVAVPAGQPQWASYFVLGVLIGAVPLAVVVWLVRSARQLEVARLALAEQAVIGERLRIDAELRQTVAAALERIADQAERAGRLAASDPPAAAAELGGLVGAARGTLAEARRMIRRYRKSSLHDELTAAATLLAAAGIQARLDLPTQGPPAALDQAARSRLGGELARLLNLGPGQPTATITVTDLPEGIRVEPRPGGTGPAQAAAGVTPQ
jgi:two-component system, NarL family, sensor histidine kinase DesK